MKVKVNTGNNTKVQVLNPSIKVKIAEEICAQGSVANSDNSYTASVDSGGLLVLPNIQVTDVDGSTRTVVSVKDIVCADHPFTYNWPEISQTTSFVTGDAGMVKSNIFDPFIASLPLKIVRPQLSTFGTLRSENVFGNFNRFTDVNGAQVYPIISGSLRYAIDHYTGIGWAYTNAGGYGADTFNAAVPAIWSLSFNGWDDWFVPPIEYYQSIADLQRSVVYQYLPWNVNVNLFFMSSSTLAHNTTLALGLTTNYDISTTNKTTVRSFNICRKHF